MLDLHTSIEAKLDKHRLRNAVATVRAGHNILLRRGASAAVVAHLEAELCAIEEELGLT